MVFPIQIRRYEPSDVAAVYEAVIESRVELAPWMPWCHADYSISDTRGWVESRSEAWERNEEWSFLITGEGGEICGGCGIHRIDFRNGVAELGYWVRTSRTRHRVATQATRQLMDWAFREQGVHRIEIISAEGNLPSQRVAENVGAVREGVLRERILLHGQRHNGVLFAVTHPGGK